MTRGIPPSDISSSSALGLRVGVNGSVVDDEARLVKSCGYFCLNESSRSQVNSGPRLEFQRTLTNGIRLRFNLASYTLRSQELALMCGRMFPEESDEVEKYIGGLPDMIRGNVMSYQPKRMEQAIKFANDQMD
ncbi:hypothetical protein Tco_0996854 [Tanacetum coccineum]